MANFKQSCLSEDVVKEWFLELTNVSRIQEYQKPYLCQLTAEFIKMLCDALHQDEYVFILTLEILEKYIYVKNAQRNKFKDILPIVVCCIYVSIKFIGSIPNIKVKTLRNLVARRTGKSLNRNTLLKCEVDILMSLNGTIPLSTPVDDLDTMLEFYIKPRCTRADLRPLCTELLVLFAICKKQLFHQICAIYSKSKTGYRAFQCLYCNRLYIPATIIVTAFRITNMSQFIDLNQLILDICDVTSIHVDHITLLSNLLLNIVKETISERNNNF